MIRDMSAPLIALGDDVIELVIDPAHGADVLTLRHRSTELDLLFSTPWRDHADEVVAGERPATTVDPVAGYVERYRGGWNTLCPNAGAPRLVHGAPVGFHGEAVTARWHLVSSTPSSARLRLELFSVPVVIERELRVEGGTVQISDEVRNVSDVPLEIDYVSHPAFGGAFLDGDVTIATNARTFTADPETADGVIAAGRSTSWPGTEDGVDLRRLPPAPRVAFGWLSEFDGVPSATITNQDLGLAVRIDWEGTHLPYAWFWQELAWTDGFPWFRRARAVAIEPASTVTSGPGRRSTLHLGPRQAITLPISLTVVDTKDTP